MGSSPNDAWEYISFERAFNKSIRKFEEVYIQITLNCPLCSCTYYITGPEPLHMTFLSSMQYFTRIHTLSLIILGLGFPKY